MSSTPRIKSIVAALLCGLGLTVPVSCSTDDVASPSSLPRAADSQPTAPLLRLPNIRAGFDYQLGGPYPPPAGATTVERDRTADPAGAGYDICYVNGFQTQPAESKSFAEQHPDLVVRDDDEPIVDPRWPGEYVLDTSTESRRAALADMVGPWIEGCKTRGYSAVEIDNLDSYTRTDGVLSVDDNLAMAAAYAQLAHRAGLAIAQKNGAELTPRLRRLGYDFAITESCVAFAECTNYTAVYPVVLDIEYTDELGVAAFAAACADGDRAPVMIMRDHFLAAPGNKDYFYSACRP